jgi:hypothetical protein
MISEVNYLIHIRTPTPHTNNIYQAKCRQLCSLHLQKRCPEKLGRFLSSFSVFECIYIIINSRMTLVHNTCKFIYICLLLRPFLLEKSVSVISMTSCMQV